MLRHPGRSETEIEYSVGFDADGIISALDCKAWCLAGAFLDLAWNDLYGVMTGLDQVTLLHCFRFVLALTRLPVFMMFIGSSVCFSVSLFVCLFVCLVVCLLSCFLMLLQLACKWMFARRL